MLTTPSPTVHSTTIMKKRGHMTKLLSDEELLQNLVFNGLTVEKISKIPKWLLENIEANSHLINTQKRLYAESVIGEDDHSVGHIRPIEQIDFATGNKTLHYEQPNWFARNQLRAEQRASMDTCVSKED